VLIAADLIDFIHCVIPHSRERNKSKRMQYPTKNVGKIEEENTNKLEKLL